MTPVLDENDRIKSGKEPKKFSPYTSLMVSGLCRSLKNANEYRLSILEKIKRELGPSPDKKK